MKNIFAAVFLLGSLAAFSQTSTSFRIPCGGVSAQPNPAEDWNQSLLVIEADHSNKEARAQIKDSLAALYRNRPHTASASAATQRSASAPAAPFVGASFAGQGFSSGTPNDNEVAIANNGHLISVMNSNIFRYRTATNTPNGQQTLGNFAAPLGNNGSKYDPKVLYDPEANRFIIVFLAGYLSSSTNIIVGFSRSDSANGNYNLYELPGNPFNDTLWSDYPMIAVNGNELFCTINLLHDNMSWQLGFVQTLIWQINKWDGYAGDTLRMELHSGINYNGRPLRNLCPVEGGSTTPQGPGMYFLSDRNLAPANDTVFLVHVSDTANSPTQQVTVTPLTAGQSYFMPPNAAQPTNTGNLATNDARILGAFIQNDQIQFVSNTMDTATGLCAVYHGRIQNVSTTPVLTANIIADTTLDYGYPNIAYSGNTAGDNTATIVFLHSDTATFPGISAVVTDGNGSYSTRTTVKAGTGYINVLNGDERWGDYSGIQRSYISGGTCWVNGMYGNTAHTHGTWIAELGVSPDVSVPAASNEATEINIFPNPFAESIEVIFTNKKAQRVRFVLYDMSGRAVTVLLDDRVREGKLRFGFSPGPLETGVYLLRAECSDGSVLFTQRVVRQ
jgi:hypothetical protein